MAKIKHKVKKEAGGGNLAARLTQRSNEDLVKGFQVGKSIALTQSADVMLITLHEDFGFGPQRVAKFYDKFHENWLEMNEIAAEDTPDHDYVKDVTDRRLRESIPPERFKPWAERYEYDLDPKTKYPD